MTMAVAAAGTRRARREEAVERRDLVYHERPRWRRRGRRGPRRWWPSSRSASSSPPGSRRSSPSTPRSSFNDFADWVIANQRDEPAVRPLPHARSQTAFQSHLRQPGAVLLADDVARRRSSRRRRSPACSPGGGWRSSPPSGSSASALLGLWEASLETLALIIVSVAVALAIGIPLGIWAGRRPVVEAALRPRARRDADDPRVLVPRAARVAASASARRRPRSPTVIFALPPAIRLTSLGHPHRAPRRSLEVGRFVRRDVAADAPEGPAPAGQAVDHARREPDAS